ncbi:XRE family transcriptional regulator [Blautia schinkii]|nr:XRE family transcriptional regulator [Blautia schinkii]NSK24221.1 XRE family transcriptional regulator [Blautia schinkii]NSK27258.1 XRE family transcriptional regulator [Blautia schinkii]NSK33614.1 XRE family transcriptional regulator [Blautia schinkii]NSK49512.1 XRE family transcriptional regulator [Blautia schinkii]
MNTFYQIVTLLDISVDQFFYPDRQNSESNCCQHIDVLLNSNEKEFVVIEATAGGIKKARETEVPGKSTYPFSRHRISAEK